MNRPALVVLGAGLAGVATALMASTAGARVTLVERQPQALPWLAERAGKPVDLARTEASAEALVAGLPRGSVEMLGPWSTWNGGDALAWWRHLGIELATRPDGRAGAEDGAKLAAQLRQCLSEAGVTVQTGRVISEWVLRPEGVKIWFTEDEPLVADRVVLATGAGRSYGLTLAEQAGQQLAPLVPSLLSFKLKDARLRHLHDLPPVPAEVWLANKPGLPSERRVRGPVQIIGQGLGGEAIADLSAWAAPELAACAYRFPLHINWVPEAGGRIARELAARALSHSRALVLEMPAAELPGKLWARLVEAARIAPDTTWGGLDKRHLASLVSQLTHGQYLVEGYLMHKPEHTWAGGIARPTIDFRTMASHVVPRLHFAGSVVDCDGLTGGYNAMLALTHARQIAHGLG